MAVEITGSDAERYFALEVAAWCERELTTARNTGHLETRPFVQNADLIIAALKEYGASKAAHYAEQQANLAKLSA
jgi:hypothetical protein